MRRYRIGIGWGVIGLTLCLAIWLSGCSSNCRSVPSPSGTVSFGATLTGTQEVPPVVTTASGSGSVNVFNNNNEVDAFVSASGFPAGDTVTQIDIDYGAPGTNGPVMFVVFSSTVNGAFNGSASAQLTSSNLQTQPTGSPIVNFLAALNAIRNGNAYFNVVTTSFPSTGTPPGELRGQIGTLLTTSTLQAAPGVTTTATGTGSILSNPLNGTLNAAVTTSGFATGEVSTVTIDQGSATTPGSGTVMFKLFDSTVNGPFTGAASLPLTAGNLQSSSGLTYAQALSAIQNGNAFYVVTTTANPTGELVGQIPANSF